MCTRPTPTRDSISASTQALVFAIAAGFHAFALLCVALAIAPLRGVTAFAHNRRPAGLADVEVQVHLGDPACTGELERIIWTTLTRAQRTWAPLALPVDRVVVAAGFPAAGRADIYDDFLAIVDGDAIREAARQRRRVVISLGVRDGTRDLDGWEVAGALAAQIQALVDERYGRHTSLAAPVADLRPAVPATTRLTRPAAVADQQALVVPEDVARNGHDYSANAVISAQATTDNEVPRLADMLATIQEGQPLVAAGLTSNGTNHP